MQIYPDERGHAMTTDSADAAAAIDRAVHNFLHWKAAIMPNMKAALEADPGFGFGHALNGLLLHGARNAGFGAKIAESLAVAQAAAAAMSDRERLYVAALEAASQGRIAESVAIYEIILAQDPTDLLAQRLSQMELFWIGEMAWSADISAKTAAHWDAGVPGYNIHLSCRAFDLEETHSFEAAERLGRQAVAIDPSDVWGTHAVAHVMIMQGRHDEGVAWLDGLKDHWADANQMLLHLWWHRCLFHLERGEPLTLKRLEDHTSPFTSAHYAVILAAGGHFQEAEALVDSMEAFASEDAGTLGPRYRAAVIPAARAAIAHRKGQHQQVVDLLMPARRMLWQMGGSHAQRDLFFLLLADSARRLDRRDLLAIVLKDIEAAGFTDPALRVGYAQEAGRVQ
jgi:tetratricopeptide (TPR) repeat protein